MTSITIRGSELSYLDKGQGPVLLFGHSYLWDSAMWAPQIEALSQHYRCIVPDLWGHGASGALPGETRNLKGLAEDMLVLMDALEVERFSIVGLSVGGMWATELAQLAPSRIQSLVLMDTFVGLEPEVTHKKYFAMLAAIEEARQVPAPLLDQIVPLFFATDVAERHPQLAQGFRDSLANLPESRIDDTVRLGRIIFGRRDQVDDLAKLALPVLIMVGQEDRARTVLESYLMLDEITGAEMVEIPKAGHISTLENPEFVNRHLLAFLERVYG
ncbi:alpha/beta fold hydrolase [Ferrimonas sp. YFM]|uniref:alpha/beta fold hydrolase n=1 Tax=Ferrimonas sp. YFM TaxID=3028878 RepID=UPI00257465D3|nr:alpha/beta fold hydrolase [Ferrimonas sp. YFM]BDY05186.1 2-succinyl-6-hydroxy-2,4-cyclohexadiene-1-carboxy late synthase [Ferrimonas sp. YFM]